MTKVVNIHITTTYVYEIDTDAFVDPWDAHEVIDAEEHHRGVRLVNQSDGVAEVTFVYDYSIKGATHG